MSNYDNQNIFAKILRGDIPCEKIYEDEYVLSFKDVNPQAPSHILIIPKGAYTDINDFIENASNEEIVEAAEQENISQIVYESADLIYHLLVLWKKFDLVPDDIYSELESREGKTGIKNE